MGHVNQFDRRSVVSALSDGEWHTFKDISAETRLGLKDVMAVTGHEPYDIIGTQQGYKLLKYAKKDEVLEACQYLGHKIYAMRIRQEAFRRKKGLQGV